MNLHTRKGDFPNFAQLRAAYLSADESVPNLDPGHHAQNSWEKELLHISELGGCPRSAAYRLTGTPDKPRALDTLANQALMFWVGYRIHHLSYSAMDWAGILVDHEYRVKLPFPWTGRGDALFLPDYEREEVCAYDAKTVLPAAIKYSFSFPKEKDCLQLGGYNAAPTGVVEYIDRGGASRPVLCELNISEWHEKAVNRMGIFESMWDHLPDLPPILPPVFTGSYWKRRGENWRDLKTVTLGADYRCGYCSYHLSKKGEGTQRESSCHPYNKASMEVATFKNGSMVSCKSGHESGVAKWLQSNIVSYKLEEVDE